MLTTDPAVPVVPPMRQHVSLLANDAIDALVFAHIFGGSVVCEGLPEHSDLSGRGPCRQCGQVVREGGGIRGHLSLVPAYTSDIASAWSIIDAMRTHDDATQMLFMMFLDIIVRDDFALKNARSMPYSKLHFIMGITPRHIAIAALQAMEIVDVTGYLRESEEGR